ncbi:PepSY domain-containing protein [Streptomyces brasiliensis]|uniref:PepSY domain-containing protein n=1 Tax=Streptomyces brasiliensis TaxID=1954 RepID=A0A917K0Q4_9ACTN|nr:PepSY domain-containing protein [Streptomyces brasiliensis]GGI95080.1 hypothetical protein GCM10010121_001870 [Streptomyces brasiliensis]
MKAFHHSPNGRRRAAATLLVAAVALGGAGAATAAAFAGDGARSGHGHVTASRASDDDHGGRRHDGRRHDGSDDSVTTDDSATPARPAASAAPTASDDDRVLARTATIDVKQAVDTAVKTVAGTVVSVELEGRTGHPVWKAELVDAGGTEREVLVDARTGAVTATGLHHQGDDDHGDD